MTRACIVAIALLIAPYGLWAQSNRIPTRQELDSLVNPPQSTKGAGALIAEPRTIELGTIEGEELVNFSFELRNTTEQKITVTHMRPSCGCITVMTEPTSIEPNASLSVVARFNPAGRSSSFRYTIKIYTDLDSALPTEQVTLTGDVHSTDEWQHLPKRAGALRLSRKEVIINGEGEERIAVANSSDRAIELTSRSTIAGLTLRCEPQVLEPGGEGDIVISYRGEATTTLNTMLILEGISATPSERMIRVTIKR